MRRCPVIVLLLLVLPLQLVWAAAAPVCGHETRAAAQQHFGHHEHQHQGSTGADDSGADALGAKHADCESCHLGASAALISTAPAVPPLPNDAVCAESGRTYRSHIPPGLERPDRLDRTVAARFGGGAEFGPHIA